MSNELNNDSAVDKYLALKALRENIYTKQPLRYNLLDFTDDIPGAGRGLGVWHSDILPSLGTISKNPEIRKSQISEAAKKIRESRGDLKNTRKQILNNSVSMGLAGVPVSAGVSILLRLLNPRLPMHGGKLRLPFTLGKNVAKLKNSNSYRQQFMKQTLDDGLKGGLFSAAAGAIPPIISSISKPSNSSISSAEEILQRHPYATALPGSDILASLDNKPNKLKNVLLGAALGGSMGAAGTFLPAGLNVPKRLLLGLLKGKLPFRQISKDFSRSARKNLLLNSALVGSSGALGGYLLSKNE